MVALVPEGATLLTQESITRSCRTAQCPSPLSILRLGHSDECSISGRHAYTTDAYEDCCRQHGIRINKQWCICFKWQNGEVLDAEIVDYH